ncbi:MAG: ribosome recycling factor [Desulfobulbaceae bacterium]|nr:ribosome recycling factor [Desulfobulbaceae bacterium]
MHTVIETMIDKMNGVIDSYKRELAKVRTGRASINLLDGLRVDAYGSVMPLNQVGTITVPESRMIQIQAWDTKLLSAIEKAIHKSGLGLNPVNDGRLIRVAIPQLTEDRRKDLVKQIKKVTEEFRVGIRNARRDAIEELKVLKNDKHLTEDELHRLQEEAQKETDKFVKKIEALMAEKDKEVMEV